MGGVVFFFSRLIFFIFVICLYHALGEVVIMIKSFKHKGLKQYFEQGITKGIQLNHQSKIDGILDLIDSAESLLELMPFYQCHELKGDRKGVYSMTVNGNWRITFEFIDGDAYILNYEDYH